MDGEILDESRVPGPGRSSQAQTPSPVSLSRNQTPRQVSLAGLSFAPDAVRICRQPDQTHHSVRDDDLLHLSRLGSSIIRSIIHDPSPRVLSLLIQLSFFVLLQRAICLISSLFSLPGFDSHSCTDHLQKLGLFLPQCHQWPPAQIIGYLFALAIYQLA